MLSFIDAFLLPVLIVRRLVKGTLTILSLAHVALASHTNMDIGRFTLYYPMYVFEWR